jgi:hypothetical protein
VPYFLVEIYMSDAGLLVLERASRMLEAAQSRLSKAGIVTRTIVAGHSREDDRLLYVIEAGSSDAARRLLSVALMPAGRIHEITLIAGGRLLAGRHPGGDVDPGIEPELVEDVVDMRLNGALGQE